MILIDFSQVFISNAIMHLSKEKDKIIEIDLLRHMIFNSIRSYLVKFRSKFGSEVVIAIDDSNSWRKSIFPNYKIKRKKARQISNIDWDALYKNLNIIVDELKENTHYKILKVNECEADDIIAILTIKFAEQQPIIIISGDKDFKQLQKYSNVKQYSPTLKLMLEEKYPQRFLKEMIITGDDDDGIPNFLSQDNSFSDKIRQKSITKINLEKWLNQEHNVFCVTGEMQRNWARNKMLIDFDEIPERIRAKIISEYSNVEVKNKKILTKYFMKNKMVQLLEVLEEF